MISLKPRGQVIATCQRNISQQCWAQHVAIVWSGLERKISTLHVHVALFACTVHTTKMKICTKLVRPQGIVVQLSQTTFWSAKIERKL